MRVLLAAAVSMALSISPSAGPQGPSAPELARRIQAHYDTVKDFKADFTQTTKGAFLRQTSVEQGHLILKKVNKLRVTYTGREKKVFVADGTNFYAHFVSDKFGTVTPLPKAGDASIALLFLAGRGNLLTDFTPALPASQPDGRWQLVLTPKTPQPDFDKLTLVVDRQTLALRGIITEDADAGTSTFEFRDLRENTGVSDREFAFAFPKGTEIRR